MRLNKQLIYVVAISCMSMLYTSCTKEPGSPTNPPVGNAPVTPHQQQLLDLVNNSRSKGCDCGNKYYPPVPAVTWNTQLEEAAKKHSEYMNGTGKLSHTGQNNSDAGERITNEGYDWMTYGENIAEGYPTEEAVIDAWLKSEGHCKNIMDAEFKEMGVATSGAFWTQVFAAK